MKYQKAEIKIDPEGFNNCPPRDAVTGYLDQELGEKGWEAVDTDIKYWKNDCDTLVFRVKGGNKGFGKGIATGRLQSIMGANELDYQPMRKDGSTIGNQIIIRIWWD